MRSSDQYIYDQEPNQPVDYLVNIDKGSSLSWETRRAVSMTEAASIYYSELVEEYKDTKFILVLRPGESVGVDKPFKFAIGTLRALHPELIG